MTTTRTGGTPMLDPTPHPCQDRTASLTPAAAAVFAGGVARFVLDGAVSESAGEEWVRRLNRDGHTEAARMVRIAVDEVGRRRLTSILPGGAR